MGNAAGDLALGVGQMVIAPKNADEANNAARKNRDFVAGLNYQPAYASQSVAPYQQSQSPLARKYLETILTGDNPAMTFSGSPNAAAVKAAATDRGNFNYGTNQQNADQGARQRQLTPWAVKPITREVGRTANGPGAMPGGGAAPGFDASPNGGVPSSGTSDSAWAAEHAPLIQAGIGDQEYNSINKMVAPAGGFVSNQEGVDNPKAVFTYGPTGVALNIPDGGLQQLHKLYMSGNATAQDYQKLLGQWQDQVDPKR